MPRTHFPTRSLPEHPHLDHLRRQAKDLLSAFLERQPDTVAEVDQLYRDADPATFALHDAQLVIARAYGFDSWRKLKAFVNGATVARLIEAVRAGDTSRVDAMLRARSDIVNMDATGNDEHRAIHHAVLMRNPEMVRLLLSHGADARIGIYPYRDATSAVRIASERGYDEIVSIIEAAEGRPYRRPGTTAPGVPTDALPKEFRDALNGGDEDGLIAFLESSPILHANPQLINGSSPDGVTLLHLACARVMPRLAAWVLARGADVHVESNHGFTPIDMLGRWPVRHPHDGIDEIAKLLLDHGADRTVFWAIATGNAEWLRARHAEGDLKNQVSEVGGFVTFAVRLDRPGILSLLLDLGFDPNERPDPANPDGKPLEYCAVQRRYDLADLLLRRGAVLTPRLAVALGREDWLRARPGDVVLAHGS